MRYLRVIVTFQYNYHPFRLIMEGYPRNTSS